MSWLKRFVWIFAIFLILPVFSFWGFQQNFPGKSIADAISLRLTSQTGIPSDINDVTLGWSSLNIPEIALRTPSWMFGIPKVRLMVFEKLEIPFWPILTSGKAKLSGKMHDGSFNMSTELLTQETLELTLESVDLGLVPVMAVMPYAFVTGNLNLEAQITNLQEILQRKNNFPKGKFKGALKEVRIRFAGGGLMEPTYNLPEIELEHILFETELNQMITFKKIQIAGSLSGSIEGTIKLDARRPKMSFIDFKVELTPSAELKKELTGLAPMLRSLQCGDTINIHVTGTLQRPNFPVRRKCS